MSRLEYTRLVRPEQEKAFAEFRRLAEAHAFTHRTTDFELYWAGREFGAREVLSAPVSDAVVKTAHYIEPAHDASCEDGDDCYGCEACALAHTKAIIAAALRAIAQELQHGAAQ